MTGVVVLAGTLALTAAAPWVAPTTLSVVAVLVAVAALVVVARHHRGPRDLGGWTVQLLLSLAPVVLLTLAYPVASRHFTGHEVGGTPLTTLLLASSLTVPWLSQAVCMPLYRGLGDRSGGHRAVEDRFAEIWPALFVQGLPVVAAFAVPVALALHLSPAAVGAYLLLTLTHSAFAQLLVVSNGAGRRREWALAWAVYALALLVAPTAWLLPPLAGVLVQLVVLRRSLPTLVRGVRAPVRLPNRDVLADLGRGLVLGAVLWSDKLVLFLVADAQIAVQTIFTALLPAVLAYNVYFVRLAPTVDESVAVMRTAMTSEAYSVLARRSAELSATVGRSVLRTGLTASVVGLVVTAAVARLSPVSLHLSVPVTLASWLLLMITLLSYKLDYIGRRAVALGVSGLHLLVCLVAFTVPGIAVADAFWFMAAADVALAVAALVAVRRHWASAEYTLFWRLATSW
ncbi:hypothetical protein CLV37_102353 [Kineococcus rhizosphaerae]|uniref:O-antigen/teichoic acid export membrane protein n=1 Tax=Kineococcus rhizosphaerae TaxID=559628 RepID=A0A2T0R8D4_9ACTN|nr:hypothetical protein CLV37_102353 [Kineococcus rhizosphaerae]